MPLNTLRFGAKCSAFYGKTQDKMRQNAVQNAAKRKSKSIKNTSRLHKQNLLVPLKTWPNRAKQPSTSGIFAAKSW